MASVDCRAQMPAVGAEAVGICPESSRVGLSTSTRQVFGCRADAVGGEVVEDRQREGRGLAGAGLRDADDVALGEQQRDGLVLDRSGSDVFLFSEGAKDRLCEAEVVKRGQFKVFLCATGPARRNAKRTPNAGFETSRVDRAVSCFEKRKRRGENRLIEFRARSPQTRDRVHSSVPLICTSAVVISRRRRGFGANIGPIDE